MPKELTERQQEIFDFIAGIIRSRGAPPTIREIMDEFDINSTNGVRTTLAALEKKGHIRRHPRLSRGIELVESVPDPLSRNEATAGPAGDGKGGRLRSPTRPTKAFRRRPNKAGCRRPARAVHPAVDPPHEE